MERRYSFSKGNLCYHPNISEIRTVGLAGQLQRCAVSVPSNIAEGTAKSTDKHFSQYLETALGSAFEWETQLIIAYEIGYISEETYKHLETKIQAIQGMLTRFMESLQ